jgi:hypothetical protein
VEEVRGRINCQVPNLGKKPSARRYEAFIAQALWFMEGE